MTTLPENVTAPSQKLKSPLQMARFVFALISLNQRHWTTAARQLDKLMTEGFKSGVRTADIDLAAGFANLNIYLTSGSIQLLDNARGKYESALDSYKQDDDSLTILLLKMILDSSTCSTRTAGWIPKALPTCRVNPQ